jgi:hypothetical protein
MDGITMEDFDPIDTNQQDDIRRQSDEKRQLAAKQQKEDFLWLMRDPRGRRLVWKQLSDAGVFLPSFSTDALTMAFNEGRRNAGLQLLAQVHAHCPELYATMTKEQQP